MEKKKEKLTKEIRITPTTHRKLSICKAHMGLKGFDELINEMIRICDGALKFDGALADIRHKKTLPQNR